jgi:adenosyl cobinamide kinase/adenosyl cobinamide phosphate guanylyltransferase
MEKDCVKRHFFYSSPPNIVDQRTKRRITEHRTDRNRDGHTTVFHNTSDLITIQNEDPPGYILLPSYNYSIPT